MYRVDLHTHTRFFHWFPERPTLFDPIGGRLNAAVADRTGLDGFAVTNHDYGYPVDADGVTVIPGIEVSTTAGHVLVVGPDPPAVTATGELTPQETVALAHDRDCAAIVAHPFRNSSVMPTDADFDAVEINGKHPHSHAWVDRLADENGLPTVGGSDAHYPPEVGRATTLVDADRLTPEAVVSAIRDGRVEVSVANRPVDRLIRRFYRRVHDTKGHLQEPDWLTPGVGRPPGEDGPETAGE